MRLIFRAVKFFPGYQNKLWQTEQMEGISVIRVWSYITPNAGFLKRIADYLSFVPPAVLASFFVSKPDLVIGTSPQFFTACAAYLVGLFKRIPFVFELRDIWPESIKAVGAMKDSLAIRMLEKLELFLYRKATLIVSVTNSFKTLLVKRGIEAAKIQIITNGVDASRFFKCEKNSELVDRLHIQNKFVAGYVGTHGMAHHLETILEAAKIAQEKADDSLRFILLGDGARKSELVQLAKDLQLSNVIFIDSVSKEDVAKYWSLLDVSIIHLKKMELFTSVIPSKLFECMAMGIPVLHGVMGESAKIVEENATGIVFEPENPEQLYAKLIELKDNNAQYEALRKQSLLTAKKFDRKELAHNFLGLLENIIHK